jgi:hypothetical protein
VEIDSSASADIFLFIFLCCFCGVSEQLSDESKTKSNKI